MATVSISYYSTLHCPLMGGLLVQRGGAWMGWGPAQFPTRCTKCNSPPINGQCINVRMMMVIAQRF